MKTRGLIKATGAELRVELGFRPDYIRMHDLTTGARLDWLSQQLPAGLEGVLRLATASAVEAGVTQSGTTPFAVTAVESAAVSLLVKGKGISPYLPSPGPVTVFRVRALQNALPVFAAPETLTWTLDTAANRTGKFSEGLPTGVGVGSLVVFNANGKLSEARITALTNDGDGDDEVTLDVAAPSAPVNQIRYAETHVATAVDNPRNGFTLAYAVGEAIAALNTNGKRLLFEAGTFDL